MTTSMLSFDTLQYAEELASAGVPEQQAKAHARAAARAHDTSMSRFATKEDLQRLATKEDLRDLRGDIKVLQSQFAQFKWVLGMLCAGMVAMLARVYFPA